MEVPRLEVKSELHLLVYTTATAAWGLSLVCDLRHSSRQQQILNPLSKARGRTHVLMDPSRVRCGDGNSLTMSEYQSTVMNSGHVPDIPQVRVPLGTVRTPRPASLQAAFLAGWVWVGRPSQSSELWVYTQLQ